MRLGRWLVLALLLGTVALYGYRAVVGVRISRAWIAGDRLHRQELYPDAAKMLLGSAAGSNRVRALALAGKASLGSWKKQIMMSGPLGAPDPGALSVAGDRYLQCLCASPTSEECWVGLAEVYESLEWLDREKRSMLPFVTESDSWSRVGRSGRIAVGMMRIAMGLAPTRHWIHDKLALGLWRFGLDSEAEEAVRDSARIVPLFYLHRYENYSALPRRLREVFADSAREVVGQLPFVKPSDHLTDLGKQELDLGMPDRAAESLRAALRERTDELRRAEAEFHLGRALVALGQSEEGKEYLRLASQNPDFHVSALINLELEAERSGNLRLALDYMTRLRRAEPKNVDFCLRFASVAGRRQEWPAALEALKWGKLIDSDDPRPSLALVRTYLAMGESSFAAATLDEVETRLEPSAELERLRFEVEQATRGR